MIGTVNVSRAIRVPMRLASGWEVCTVGLLAVLPGSILKLLSKLNVDWVVFQIYCLFLRAAHSAALKNKRVQAITLDWATIADITHHPSRANCIALSYFTNLLSISSSAETLKASHPHHQWRSLHRGDRQSFAVLVLVKPSKAVPVQRFVQRFAQECERSEI